MLQRFRPCPLMLALLYPPPSPGPQSTQGQGTYAKGVHRGNHKCELQVKDNQQAVQCDICMNWYHILCQDIPKSAFNALKRHDAISFICSFCKRLPNLEKFQPRAPMKDMSTQTPAEISHPNDSSPTEVTRLTTPSSWSPSVLSELVIKMNSLENMLKEPVSALSEYIGTSSTRTSATSMTRPGHPLSSNTFGRSYTQTLAGDSAPEDQAQCSSANLPSATSGSVPRNQYDRHTQDGQSATRVQDDGSRRTS